MGTFDAAGRPQWLTVRIHSGPNYEDVRKLMRSAKLHTVCEEARCPNVFECWEQRTATFMILGNVCTRACRFCAVESGRPTELDLAEPDRVAQATRTLGLRHVVVTSVARDDLADGGSAIFAQTIRAVRQTSPSCTIEVLIPDFGGSDDALGQVLEAEPDILNHNLETVRRLSDTIRSRARYARSLRLLRTARQMAPNVRTKSGLMLGLGETDREIGEALRDLRAADCQILTLGQYLRPSPNHAPVERYVSPEAFESWKRRALSMGFHHVESGPLVRSSYHAAAQARGAHVDARP